MTIRMQETEAAENFSRFLAHLEAGDQVEVEREGKTNLTVRSRHLEPSHLDQIEPKLLRHEEVFGPVLLEPETVEILRMAHDEFNAPLEPRMRWD